MAEHDNVRIVREGYEAFGRGDIAGLLDRVTDDVEWISAGSSEIPYAGRFRGRDRVREFFTTLAANVDFQTFEPREFIAQGDTVVVLGHEVARAKSTTRQMSGEWAMVFRMRDGKIARFQEYSDTENAAAAFSREERRAAAA